MRKLLLAASGVLCLSLGLGIAQAAHTDAVRTPRHRSLSLPTATGRYMVRLQEPPAAIYSGGLAGYAATNPRVRGERVLDVRAAAAYTAYLDARQASILDQATRLLGHALVVRYRYHLALDGMSVELTPAEAQRVATLPGVLSVRAVQRYAPLGVSEPATAGDTNASRAWVNAPAVWQLPTHSGTDNEGEGIVLAELDTGINHANSSFAATGPLDGYVAQDPAGLRFGVCDSGNASQSAKEPAFFSCNDKLIGAYTYTQGLNDPNSPEDSEGHGSHTASTAVGDFVTTTVNGQVTPLSGVAPHASLIAYDVCDPTDLCAGDVDAAAIEQAIQDQATLKKHWGSAFKGMVLNYSIGDSDTPYDNQVDLAFLSAEEAGIYVSAAGGNGGPSNIVDNDPSVDPVYPVEHLGPWVATMAAATHDGTFSHNLLENFSGGDPGTLPTAPMAGDGNTVSFAAQPLVYTGSGSFDSGESATCGTEPSGVACVSAGTTAANADQCLFPFNPGTFIAGEIVVCDRGTNPLVDKAYNVQQGGAAGMVIATTTSSSQQMVVEAYVIPATLLDLHDANKLRTWLAASSSSPTPASAALSGSTLTIDTSQADQLAGFSSREPVDNAFDSLIKPDLAAPGVSVLAALGDPGYADGCSSCSSIQPETYGFDDGTSMATPHGAGAAALLKQAHPGWTPSEIKSALMLTAVTGDLTDQCQTLDTSNNCQQGHSVPSPQVRGAGRIDIDAAERAGLMLDESGANYEAANPDKGGDLTTLNLASLANRACAASCSWTRSFTSTLDSTSVAYQVSVSGLSGGLAVSVSPASFTLAPGRTQLLTVTADTSKVAKDDWVFASVNLRPVSHPSLPDMHMPVAVRSTGATTPPGGGSGGGSGGKSGGGDLGLLELAALTLMLRRRRD